MKKIQDLGKKDVIHCETEEEAIRILKMAHGLGLRWSDGASFLDRNYWSVKKDRTAYALLRGEYCNIESYQEMGYTIHRASEFLEPGAGLLPEKWAILIDSQEVIDVVGAWLDEKNDSGSFQRNWQFDFVNGQYFTFPSDFTFPGVGQGSHVLSDVPIGYTRISLEQFKEVYPQIKKGDWQIRKGDWVYFGDRWETVMQFNRKDRTLASCGINSYTRYRDGGIEFRENDMTSSPIRLATEEELARIRDAYKPEIQKGDWVYHRCGDAWEAVMQFDYERGGFFYGTNCFTLSDEGDVEHFKTAHARNGIRLATPEELARIRDAYRPAEFDDLIKELERNFQEPPAAGWKSPVAELAADQWNEALKLAINLLKDKQKV